MTDASSDTEGTGATTPDPPTTFVVVDNQEAVLVGVAAHARERPDVELWASVREVADLDLAVDPPDVVVLDLYLGRDDTPSTPSIPALVAWGARVLVHTSAEFPVPVREAVAAGAHGLSLKNDGLDALADAVVAVAAGEFACSSTVATALLTDPDLVAKLSAREREVVESVHDGLTHREIGRRLGISDQTVKDNLKTVRGKYVRLGRGISNAHSIVREARRDGYLG